MKVRKISWALFNKFINNLSNQIISQFGYGKEFTFKNIFGIPRGGLITAVILSHRLNVPLITDEELINHLTLIIDDIEDSGRTVNRYKTYKSFGLICLLTKIPEDTGLLLYARKVKKKSWIQFPWETDKTTVGDYNKVNSP